MSNTLELRITQNGELVKSVVVFGEQLLGRDSDCPISLNDRSISRKHALFRSLKDGSLQVEKKSDFAPLILNGGNVDRALLKDGDLLQIGVFKIQVKEFAAANKALPVKSIEEADLKLEEPEPPENKTPDLAQEIASQESKPSDELILDAHEGESVIDSFAQSVHLNEGTPGDGELEDEIAPSSPGEGDVLLSDPNALEDPAQIPVQGSDTPDPSQFFEAIGENDKTNILSAEKVVAKLVFKPGEANVEEYELSKPETYIGRSKECEIVIEDKKSSRKNTVITRSGANFFIRDLESSNGTFVNHLAIKEQGLSGGDYIQIGNTEFQFIASSKDYEKQEKNLLPVSQADEGSAPQMVLSMDQQPAGMLSGDGGIPQEYASNVPPLDQGQGIGGFSPILGTEGPSKGKQTLIEKFRAQPKVRQILIIIVILFLFSWLMEDDKPDPKKLKKGPQAKASASPKPSSTNGDKTASGSVTFESLTPEQQRYVENQHSLAFDYYKNREYDKAIFEIDKIFSIIDDYKDSREIERYAKEGKRKIDAIEEEKRKKEEEEQLKIKISGLIEEAKRLMDKKDYKKAVDVFTSILALDPDNAMVAEWRKTIDNYEDSLKLKREQTDVEIQINKHAWEIFKDGEQLRKKGKFHSAIETYQKAIDVGASDPKVAKSSKAKIAFCRQSIKNLRDPVLVEAKTHEEASEFPEAFALYKKATRIDPPHPAGYAGMNRIRGVLHNKAKEFYIEGIIAESYSDFANAKKQYIECLKIAPEDDIYHDRAKRRLSHYDIKEVDTP